MKSVFMGHLFLTTKSRRFNRFATLLSLAVLVTSCVVVPVPITNPPPRNFSDESLDRIVPCEWGQEDVAAWLGEPTSIWPDNHVYFYHEGLAGAVRLCGVSFLGSGDAGCADPDFSRSDLLLIRFDENWRVIKIYQEHGPVDADSLGGFLREWESRTSEDVNLLSCPDNQNRDAPGNLE